MRISSGPRCLELLNFSKSQSLHFGSFQKTPMNSSIQDNFQLVKPMKFSTESYHNFLELDKLGKPKCVFTGFRTKNSIVSCDSLKYRSFSSSFVKDINGARRVVKAGKTTLPWLAANRDKNVNGLEKKSTPRKDDDNRSSWEKSSKRSEKKYLNGRSSWDNSTNRLDKVGNRSSWEESARGLLEKEPGTNNRLSSWDELEKGFKKDFVERIDGFEEEENVEEEMEAIPDPRWDKIKSRFGGENLKPAPERPELRRWNKQENWGRKTWKEATESTVPKMIGDGIYGIGPVLAALSAGRREFYALYVQEGLDLSSKNKKKKDNKAFEKVLKMAEKNALSIKEISKHDLNMVVDNRPHQGLVLDCSPLEMVKIKELDPISVEEDKGSLWVALDEVTDPQNLGAIIRSTYFFGASGVVLCSKNSAPLSGVVSKASAGSLELMELRYCKNMMQFLTSSAENGWRVLGGSVSPKAIPLKDFLPGEPTILVLGSEGTGLRALVERSCTQLVRIPGNVPVDVSVGESDDTETTEIKNDSSMGEDFRSFLAVESLNVSVAAGVLLHHLVGNYYKNDNNNLSENLNNALE